MLAACLSSWSTFNCDCLLQATPLISACSPQVLELMKEVAEEEDDENISSDISGNAL